MTTSSSSTPTGLESSDVKPSYFNLHITGLGYLNRVRTVTPRGKKRASFLCCSIAALTGPREDVDYFYFDAKVVGQEAERLIRKCKDAADAGCKVLMGFKLSDPWLDFYQREKRQTDAKDNGQAEPTDDAQTAPEESPQIGVCVKTRLILIYWIKINGERVYTHESKVVNGTGATKVPAIAPAEALAPASESSEADAEMPPIAASA